MKELGAICFGVLIGIIIEKFRNRRKEKKDEFKRAD